LHLAGHGLGHGRAVPPGPGGPPRGRALVLTVDFRRLGLRRNERVLDLGCGGGRHAYESLRRGARVVALDASDTELKDVAVVLAAMVEEGEAAGGGGAAVNGNALALPFPDHAFDRVIAAE